MRASCPPGGLALDFFAGSGTLGAAALRCGRNFILVDSLDGAYQVMQKRFAGQPVRFAVFDDAVPSRGSVPDDVKATNSALAKPSD